MPVYVYQCSDCSSKYTEEQLREMADESYEEAVLFETYHTIEPTKEELEKAVVCPRCDSHNCQKSFHGVNVSGYLRGYGWKDKAGAKRDMHVYHLDNQDPYSKHRVPGEKEHIRAQLKKEGKHDPKTQYFVGPKNSKSDNK